MSQIDIAQLHSELAEWKEGCERNADCLRDSARRCDEQRLKILALKSELRVAIPILNEALNQWRPHTHGEGMDARNARQKLFELRNKLEKLI